MNCLVSFLTNKTAVKYLFPCPQAHFVGWLTTDYGREMQMLVLGCLWFAHVPASLGPPLIVMLTTSTTPPLLCTKPVDHACYWRGGGCLPCHLGPSRPRHQHSGAKWLYYWRTGYVTRELMMKEGKQQQHTLNIFQIKGWEGESTILKCIFLLS